MLLSRIFQYMFEQTFSESERGVRLSVLATASLFDFAYIFR
jgi:hypothetical protein